MKNLHCSLVLPIAAFAFFAAPATVLGSDLESILTAQISHEGSNIAWGQAVIELDEPVDQVLPIIVDYANYVQFMPNFKKSRVLAQRGSRARVYMEVSVAKGAITLWGQLDIAEGQPLEERRIVEAKLLEGNIDAFSATWELNPIDGGSRTQVTFRIRVDPDLPLPSSVFSRENERAAARTVRALRERVAEPAVGAGAS